LIDEHLEELSVQFPPDELKRAVPPTCEVIVDVAVFFDTANVTAPFTRRSMEIINSYAARLELSCYPSHFNQSD
jgi:hypothetical protein